MLDEPNQRQLLESCERLVGRELAHARGQLMARKDVAATLWELMVLEAASEFGPVEYEPGGSSSPDVHLQLSSGRAVWIEAAFLYSRFQDGDRGATAAMRAICKAAERSGIDLHLIGVRFDGAKDPAAGYVRAFPPMHEMAKRLNQAGLAGFLQTVRVARSERHSVKLGPYSIEVTYDPSMEESESGYGGLVQEAAKDVEEHAVYRSLCKKGKQHPMTEPYVVAIGSDTTHALSRMAGPGCVPYAQAVAEACRRYTRISAALIVRIETKIEAFTGFAKTARTELFLNPSAAYPLSDSEVRAIARINFNRRPFGLPI